MTTKDDILRGSLWGHFAVTLRPLRGSLWGHFAATLGVPLGHFGATSGVQVTLQSLRSHFGGHFAVTKKHNFNGAVTLKYYIIIVIIVISWLLPFFGGHFAVTLQSLRGSLCGHFAAAGITLSTRSLSHSDCHLAHCHYGHCPINSVAGSSSRSLASLCHAHSAITQPLLSVLGHWHCHGMSPCHSTLPQSLALGHSATLRTQPLTLPLSLASLCHAYHSVTGALLPLSLTLSLTLSLAVTRRVPLSELGCHYSQNSTTCGIIIVTTTGTYNQSLTAHYWHCKKHGKGPVASLLLSLPPYLSIGGLADTLTIRSMAEGPGAMSLTHSLPPCLSPGGLHSLPPCLSPGGLADALLAWRPSSLGGHPLGGRPHAKTRRGPLSDNKKHGRGTIVTHSLTPSMHASQLAAGHPLTGRPLGVVRCRQLAHAQARVYDALEVTTARCVVLLVPPA
jgi:hypothetical protein